MERLFGGSPAAVILKLAIASTMIGVVLSFFGFHPADLYDAMVRIWRWISFDVLERVVNYLLLGAIVVIPLWFLSRLFSIFGSERRQKQD